MGVDISDMYAYKFKHAYIYNTNICIYIYIHCTIYIYRYIYTYLCVYNILICNRGRFPARSVALQIPPVVVAHASPRVPLAVAIPKTPRCDLAEKERVQVASLHWSSRYMCKYICICICHHGIIQLYSESIFEINLVVRENLNYSCLCTRSLHELFQLESPEVWGTSFDLQFVTPLRRWN